MEIRTGCNAVLPCLYRASRQSSIRHSSPFTRSLYQSNVFQSARHMSSTSSRWADQPPRKPSSDEMPSTTPSTQSTDFTAMINQALDFTKQSPNTSQGRTSRFASDNMPASTKSRSSLDDLAAGFGSRNNSNRNSFNVANMLDPTNRTGAHNFRTNKPEPVRLPDPLPAYGPSVGRTVAVDPNRGMDVGRAFRSLEINCSRNKVRADFNRQRFHERGGLKRKRLRSERWRRRFKEGFRGMVKMVSQMKKQGW
ncbi:hypothetical protein BDV97DRAFT_396631 [Delphinella strobiligena]|nr:hypothetical protein BDV97DRAFT_396631 [Delphinella strobiligena]